MNDDTTALALRDHLEHVLAGLAPQPSLLTEIHHRHDRRVRRHALALSTGAALTVAAATAVVLIGAASGASTGGDRKRHQPTPLASSPSYSTPKPQESWFTGKIAFPRPTGEIAVYPVQSWKSDPTNSRRSLLVWYDAPARTYCAHDILQTPDNPDGDPGPRSGGSCAAIPRTVTLRTELASYAGACGGFEYVLGLVGPDAPKVEARAIGGPNPDVIVRRLDDAPMPFYLVRDAKAQALMMRYYNAAGHFLRYQMARIPPNARSDVACAVDPPG